MIFFAYLITFFDMLNYFYISLIIIFDIILFYVIYLLVIKDLLLFMLNIYLTKKKLIFSSFYSFNCFELINKSVYLQVKMLLYI